jgi:hypothetical protein
MGAAAFGSGFFVLGSKFLGDSGRYHVWKMALSFWEFNASRSWLIGVLGFGPGTYGFFGPAVQSATGGSTIFPWLHNEYLQVLFENGIVGLSLVLILLSTALYKTRKNPCLFAQISTFAFVSITQFTGRVFFTELLGVCLLYQTFTLSHWNRDTVLGGYLLDCARNLPRKSKGPCRPKVSGLNSLVAQVETQVFQRQS